MAVIRTLRLAAALASVRTLAASVADAAVDDAGILPAALELGDECLAAGASDANPHCALNALQMRAASKQAAKESSQARPAMEPLKANGPTPEPPKAAPTNPIVIKGSFLYDSVTGKRFFAKGVAYNPRSTVYDKNFGRTDDCKPGTPNRIQNDYSADITAPELEDEWRPALKAIANLGANTVRLYNINPDIDHSKFMEAAASFGLYVIIPLTRKDWGFLPAFAAPDCYTKEIEGYGNIGVNLLTSGKLIVKQFSKYNNTLLFTIANEMVVNDKNGYSAFPCVKAFTRDIHRYQASCSSNMRRVPLIYSGQDVGAPTRYEIGDYLTCELDSVDDAVDAYGVNVYSWCDESYPDQDGKDNFQYSPYLSFKKDFQHYSKPVLFTEFGCNQGAFKTKCPYKGGRKWTQVKAIIEEMGEVLSGAIAFEFSMEQNEFGLALTPGFLEGQDSLHLLDNYYALQKEFHKWNISSKLDGTGVDMKDCSWKPSSSTTREKPQCMLDKAKHIQERRGTDTVVSWAELPPTPEAPLVNVKGQAECPADDVPVAALKEGCCHMDCKDE